MAILWILAASACTAVQADHDEKLSAAVYVKLGKIHCYYYYSIVLVAVCEGWDFMGNTGITIVCRIAAIPNFGKEA